MAGLLSRLFSAAPLLNGVTRFAPLVAPPCTQQLALREKSTKPKRRKVHPFHWWVRKNRADMTEDHLTRENKDFLLEEANKMYLAPGESPLREEPWPVGEWAPDSHRTGVVARKIGVYPMWKKDGTRILTTLLQVCEQNVLDYIPPEVFAATKFGFKARGMGALIVGAESRPPLRFTQEYLERFRLAGVAPKKKITRFLVTPNAALQPGTPLFVSHFRPGDHVNVYGKTIDRGWMGACRRWGMRGGRKTHGVTKNHHRGGAMGGPRGRILKGKKMGGHEGAERKLCVGLRVWRINHQHNVIWVHGPAVPGEQNAFVHIFDCYVPKKAHTADNPPPFPTYLPPPPTADGDLVQELPDEVYDPELQRFDDPSIVFQEEEQIKRKLKVKAKVKAAGGRR